MISTAKWQEKGSLVPINGHDIFHVDTGDRNKKAILLIHGFPTSSWDWCKVWEQLSKRYRLVALDMLGFGFSDKPDPHSYSIMEQADIVEGLVTKLGLKTFHVLAHDYGDTVAQELLARQNAGTGIGGWESVCLLNGGLFPETHQALFIQKLLLSPLGPLVNKLTTKKRFDKSMSRVFGAQSQPSTKELAGFWELINYNQGRHIFHNLITYMKDRRTHRDRWVAAMTDTEIPIALINGSVDPVSGAHMVEHYINIVGEPRYLKQLSDIGHYPQVEAPDQVIESYLEFLDSLSR